MFPAPEDPPAAAHGARDRLDREMAGLYDALRSVARRVVRGRTGKRLIEPTELVHECFIKLARNAAFASLTRSEFMALAATTMRTVLVDRARELATLKRGAQHRRLTLDASVLVQRDEVDLLGLDAALNKLAQLDERMARAVELRFFGGLEIDEVAKILGVSSRTIDHDWAVARAWLHRELAR